jgi:hypothetical protein
MYLHGRHRHNREVPEWDSVAVDFAQAFAECGGRYRVEEVCRRKGATTAGRSGRGCRPARRADTRLRALEPGIPVAGGEAQAQRRRGVQERQYAHASGTKARHRTELLTMRKRCLNLAEGVEGSSEAKVAVGESGRQARLLTEGVGVDAAMKQKKSSVLEFATGRLPDNVDRPTNKAAVQKSRVVVIAGPTAVGESRVAIALANKLGGEIISADSIQVGLLAAPLIPFSASETSSAANALKEELALARSQLKEAEDEAA